MRNGKKVFDPDGRVIKFLTQEELRRFFDAIPRNDPRSRILFWMIYRYAMRTQEACDLPIDAVNLTENTITIQGMKGGLRRRYPLFPGVLRLARRWKPRWKWYFWGRQGPMKRTMIWRLFKRYMERAELPANMGVHTLRHSAAVHAGDAGATVEEIQDLLRLKSIETAIIYANMSTRRRNHYLKKLEDSEWVVKE